MSTIVDFRRRREEAERARMLSAPAGSAPVRPSGVHSSESTADIILFPRKERIPRKPRRKALKRRFALQAAARAMP